MTYKQITIVPYDSNWPQQFEHEAECLKETLDNHCMAVHHIGSTSVPDLSAKNVLDILCIVDTLPSSLVLENIGYTYKGEMNIPLHYYFSKKTEDLKINLHVVEPDHGFIALNLCFRDYLRTHEEARLDYSNLKETLLKDPTSQERVEKNFTGYNLGKDDFIKNTLEKASFKGLTINFCMHRKEWAEYHRIRKEQIFDLSDVVYDPQHPTITDPLHYHFALYEGIKIVGVAHIEFLPDDVCVLRPFAIDLPHQNRGLGSVFLKFIEKWLKYQGKKIIYLNANPPAISFYNRLGYSPMSFHDNGSSLFSGTIKMGKIL